MHYIYVYTHVCVTYYEISLFKIRFLAYGSVQQ